MVYSVTVHLILQRKEKKAVDGLKDFRRAVLVLITLGTFFLVVAITGLGNKGYDFSPMRPDILSWTVLASFAVAVTSLIFLWRKEQES